MIGNTFVSALAAGCGIGVPQRRKKVAAPQFGGGDLVGEGIKGEQHAFTGTPAVERGKRGGIFQCGDHDVGPQKSGVPLSVSRRRNRPASSRRIGRKHPPAATPEVRAFHPQATSPNGLPRQPAQLHALQSRRRLSLPAFDHRPQETSRPRDHTPFPFPVGLGLGASRLTHTSFPQH